MDATDKQNSVSLHAFLASPTLMVIVTKDAEQVKLVRRLFQNEHRRQINQGSRWHITSLDTYEDLPLVKNAREAFRLQYTLEGACPATMTP